jgi:hypothetical protein
MSMTWVGHRSDEATARALLADPEPADELFEAASESSVDIEKAWHGLHWMLAQGGSPFDEAILGGEAIGQDLGYGPSRLLAPGRVRLVAEALEGMSSQDLGDRFDAVAMTADQVYPFVWDEDGVFDAFLAPAFGELRDFYLAAAGAGEAVIQTIC